MGQNFLQSSLQADTMKSDVCGQACLKYSKKQVYKEVSDEDNFLHTDKHKFSALSFWIVLTGHAQSTQTSSIVNYLCNIWDTLGMKVIFLHADKHQNFSVDNVIFDWCTQNDNFAIFRNSMVA